MVRSERTNCCAVRQPTLLLFKAFLFHILRIDGLPLANMFLNDTVQGVSGKFLPVAPAVTSKNRIYVLTEFAPDENQNDVNVLGLQRLYAIDTSTSLANGMKIVWHANFENELPYSNVLSASLRFGSESYARRLTSTLRDPSVLKPSILWDAAVETIYLALPPPMLPGSRLQGGDRLFAIQDTGKEGSMVFQAQISVQNMVMYDGSADRNPSNAADQLWVSAPDGRLLAMKKTGVIGHVLDMPAILKTNFTITSKITTARGRGVDEDFLLFGINVQQPTAAFKSILSSYGVEVMSETPANYVIGVDTPENIKGMPLAWILPTPEDTVVFGQIIGIKGDGSSIPDQLIVYSQIKQKFAKIFSIIAQK
ncbi:hypothetical protein DPMN_012847 [Dreissena polymorpha]|uniref:Uncharacterized protein n=1 Tax=Dreissena polymorpha TaxID=45954 RepID=A0A9D4S378_DREPO|nr:hypothetical protein DPMN_012847 [Dreissena polymorpha]